MIPILYEKDETTFEGGGIGYLVDATLCTTTEERNGVFELEMEYPIKGPLYSALQEGRYIYANHDETQEGQPFEIYGRSEPINEVVTFYAHHISYKLRNVVVRPIWAASCYQALFVISQKLMTPCSFTFSTDKQASGTLSTDIPMNVRSLLCGEEGSILDIYGGEYEWDLFNVMLHNRRGEDTDIEIRKGKNLVDFKHDVDASESYNAVVPFWYNEDEGLVTLPENFITIQGATEIRAEPLDLTGKFESKPSEYELRQAAVASLMGSEAWKYTEDYEINFAALWQTDEYKQYAPLQRVKLCDSVLVYYPEYGIQALREKVVKTVYNVLLDRYDSITLNKLPATFSGVIS